MKDRQRLLRWMAGALMVIGILAMVLGAVGAGPFVFAPATATLTPTLTPEPIVPTRTPVPPTRTPTMAPSAARVTSTPGTAPSPAQDPPTAASQIDEPAASPTARPVMDASPTTPDAATPSDVSAPTQWPTAVQTARPTAAPTSTPLSTPTAVPSARSSFIVPRSERFRLGVSLPYGAEPSRLEALEVGWVMDWHALPASSLPGDVAHAATVRMGWGELRPDPATVQAIAAARPGATWLIANEADVRWQDNVTPEVYAHLYHQAYTAIRAGDPTAVIAAGGIAQPTELRLRYLDLALAAYEASYGEPLPADAWHIHNYMLREERNSWGVDIPPGIPDDTGELYGISDSGNLELFKAQIYDFRRWMLARGYGGQPLIVSEFGIPMPADYGFPPEVVESFLRETWRFFLTASDPVLGHPGDGGRLVQRWCWFSIEFSEYPTGDLVGGQTGDWTPLGRAWLSMVSD